MNDTLKDKILELRKMQDEVDSNMEKKDQVEMSVQKEYSFDLIETETLTFANFSLQRELLEMKMKDLDRAVAGFHRRLFDRLELDPLDWEIGFDDNCPNKIFARLRTKGDTDEV